MNNSSRNYRRPSPQKRAETPARTKRQILVTDYDPIIFICVFILLLIGIVMVLSSSYYSALRDPKVSSMFFYFRKQFFAACLGFVAMIVMAMIDYHLLGPVIPFFYAIANGLLVYARLYGEPVNGAYRWVNLGISFQPSEFAKAMVVLMLAYFLAGGKDRTKSLSGLLGSAAIVALPCFLVFWGNNLSTALIIVAIGFSMLFVSRSRVKLLLGSAFGGAGALFMYLQFFSGSFRGGRLEAWKDPWKFPTDIGFQTIQSLYAVASGGLFGLGLGQSRQKLKYMPEPQNDFIFAVICEELGFFGAAVVLLLFGILIWRSVKVALNAADLLGSLIATGIVAQIGVQVIINVSVVTNTLPNTGIPLPFISFGGTSLAFLMAMMGVLLNVSKFNRIK